MRHARRQDLDRLAPLLAALRKLTALKEKSRGVFYRGAKAFRHFHEDASEFFADLRSSEDFERFPVTTEAQREGLLKAVTTALRKHN